MSKLFFKVHRAYGCEPALYPSDRRSADVLGKFKHGDIVSTNKPTKPRNPKHSAKYWAMLGLVHEATAISERFPTTKKLHAAIKGALGYYETVRLPDGKEFHVLDSIAFESMDQTAFEEFYERAVDIIVTQLVPHMDREDLVREVERMIDGR